MCDLDGALWINTVQLGEFTPASFNRAEGTHQYAIHIEEQAAHFYAYILQNRQ